MDTGLDNRGTFYKSINTIQQNSGSQSASRVVDKKIKGERVRRKLWTLSLNFCSGGYRKELSQKGNIRVRDRMFFQEILFHFKTGNLKHNFIVEKIHDQKINVTGENWSNF